MALFLHLAQSDLDILGLTAAVEKTPTRHNRPARDFWNFGPAVINRLAVNGLPSQLLRLCG
jgi:hypothetical protein